MSKSTRNLIGEFQGAFDEFCRGYMSVQRLAERSRVEYETDILKFLLHFQESGVEELKAITLQKTHNYLQGLEKAGFAPATIRKKILVIKLFFSWIRLKKLIPNDPTSSILLPQKIEDKPFYLSSEECRQLLDQVNSTRDKAIVQLLLGSGITLSEIRNVTLSDISDLNISTQVTPGVFGGSQVTKNATGILHVRGKGVKDRKIPLDHSTCDVLIAYLEKRPESINNFLFPSTSHRPLSGRQIENIVKKNLLKAGIDDANVHSLRHSFAMNQLRAGVEPMKLKELMGLNQSRSISRYLG